MMEQDSWQRRLGLISQIGVDPADTATVRLQKAILTAFALLIIFAGTLWGLTYLAFQEVLAGSIPLSYAAISTVTILIFARTHHLAFFRLSQLGLYLVLPFLLMIALGGFVNASAVVLWSIFSPIAALLVGGLRQARGWFLGYMLLIVASGFMERVARPSNNLPEDVINVFFVLNIGAISAIVFVVLYYFIAQKNHAYDLLELEQDKSERLLLNVLPQQIADELKRQPGIVATSFEDASVLFADIVGFTQLSTKLSPVEMIEVLNEIFSHFDMLVDKYGLEKIRTIGDSYMVAAGVPTPRADHCEALARFALEICDYMAQRPSHKGQPIQFRVGMNCGPMIGGVIGQHKFHYDVWGDTVNTASRMESHGAAQKIQITQDCYERLKDTFVCEPRGVIDVKGKGEMPVWFLLGEKVESVLA